jgi:predicted phage-related endonuclease
MLIEAIEQRGERWLEWRKGKGTASDAAAVMGMSQWYPKTWYELFLVKTGRETIKETDAMRWGTQNEPIAREEYQRLYGFECQPLLVSKPFGNFTLGCSSGRLGRNE